MNRLACLLFSFLALLLFSVASYWCGLGANSNELFRNIAYLAAPVFAVMGGLYALALHGWRGMASRPFLLFVIGLGLWAIGEVFWVYFDFIAREAPYPSTADYFYLLAYPVFFFALLSQVKRANVNWKKIDPVLVFLLSIIAVLLAVLAAYFGVYLAYDGASSLLENAVAIGYGLGDMLLVLCSLLVLILAWEYKGGNLMRLYLYCFFTFSMTFIADIGFAIYNPEYLAGDWWIKNTLDTLWIMQYLYFGLAFFSFGLSLKGMQQRFLTTSKSRS